MILISIERRNKNFLKSHTCTFLQPYPRTKTCFTYETRRHYDRVGNSLKITVNHRAGYF